MKKYILTFTKTKVITLLIVNIVLSIILCLILNTPLSLFIIAYLMTAVFTIFLDYLLFEIIQSIIDSHNIVKTQYELRLFSIFNVIILLINMLYKPNNKIIIISLIFIITPFFIDAYLESILPKISDSDFKPKLSTTPITEDIAIIFDQHALDNSKQHAIFSTLKLTNNFETIKSSNKLFSKESDIQIRLFIGTTNLIQSAIDKNLKSINIGYLFDDIGSNIENTSITKTNKFKLQYIQELNELSKQITIVFTKLSFDKQQLSSNNYHFAKLIESLKD